MSQQRVVADAESVQLYKLLKWGLIVEVPIVDHDGGQRPAHRIGRPRRHGGAVRGRPGHQRLRRVRHTSGAAAQRVQPPLRRRQARELLGLPVWRSLRPVGHLRPRRLHRTAHARAGGGLSDRPHPGGDHVRQRGGVLHAGGASAAAHGRPLTAPRRLPRRLPHRDAHRRRRPHRLRSRICAGQPRDSGARRPHRPARRPDDGLLHAVGGCRSRAGQLPRADGSAAAGGGPARRSRGRSPLTTPTTTAWARSSRARAATAGSSRSSSGSTASARWTTCARLSRHMERDLAAEVPGLRFRIVPVWGPEETRAEPGGDGAIKQAPVHVAEPTPVRPAEPAPGA